VNLGNPVEFTIRQLAETVIALTGSSSKIAYRPLPEDDPRQRCPDISLAQNLLAWAPRVQLRDGLMKTIEYFERLLRSDPSDERLQPKPRAKCGIPRLRWFLQDDGAAWPKPGQSPIQNRPDARAPGFPQWQALPLPLIKLDWNKLEGSTYGEGRFSPLARGHERFAGQCWPAHSRDSP